MYTRGDSAELGSPTHHSMSPLIHIRKLIGAQRHMAEIGERSPLDFPWIAAGDRRRVAVSLGFQKSLPLRLLLLGWLPGERESPAMSGGITGVFFERSCRERVGGPDHEIAVQQRQGLRRNRGSRS